MSGKNDQELEYEDYVLLEKEVHAKIIAELARMDSLYQHLDSLQTRLDSLNDEIEFVSGALKGKMQQVSQVKEELIDTQLSYDDQLAHYKALNKELRHLLRMKAKRHKIIKTRTRYIVLKKQDRFVMIANSLALAIFYFSFIHNH